MVHFSREPSRTKKVRKSTTGGPRKPTFGGSPSYMGTGGLPLSLEAAPELQLGLILPPDPGTEGEQEHSWPFGKVNAALVNVTNPV